MFNIPVACEPWMKMHVRQYRPSKQEAATRPWYISQAEWDSAEVVIDKKPKRILDYGCGLGRMSVYVHKQFQDPAIEYVLFDGDSTPSKQGAGTGFTRQEIFYNNLRMTELFCRSNDLTNYMIVNAEEQPLSDAGEVDLVMSFLSLGYHYPIEDKLDEIIEILNPEGTVVAGVREGLYLPEMFISKFKSVELRPIKYFAHYSENEELLILKRPKKRHG